MGNQQWVHLVIILLVVSMSVLSWLYRQFKAYQSNQAGKVAAQRRREQVLRTGRADEPSVAVPPARGVSVHDDARKKLMELAARRKAQLEEMARRAAAGGGVGSAPRPTAPLPAPVRRAPAAPSPKRPIARPAQQPTPPQPVRGVPSQRQRQAELEQARRRQELRARAEATRQRAERERAAREQAQTAAGTTITTTEPNQPAEGPGIEASQISDAGVVGQPRSTARSQLAATIAGLKMGANTPRAAAEAWRRAIVMTEILGPSIAMRGATEPPDHA